MKLLTSIPFLKNKSKSIPKQVISASWCDRAQILDEDVNLFCWERSLHPFIQKFLLEVLDREPEPLEFSISQTGLRQQLEKGIAKWNIHSSVDSESFWQDIFALANDFLGFSKDRSGTMHLRVIQDDACTKFHTDGYPLRLFTTYFGQGTEWLPEDSVDRSALGTTNDRIVRNQGKVKKMETGDVGILKRRIT